ncbi:ribosomal RNA small subunit methyltransferase E [Erysipelotrichaceae bacterium]|nr:ribosomal RNA small subunit methyltransferase E [Erysipelotrichaceae bacterium]
MQQYFIEGDDYDADHLVITGTDVHHIKNVMRMKITDKIRIVSQHIVYLGEITAISADAISVKKIKQLDENRELKQHITIALGLLKQDKFEYALQKMTELGMHTCIPWQAKLSVVKLYDKKAQKKQLRWQLIAKEAAEQSRRSHIPKIEQAKTSLQLTELFSQYDVVYIAYEDLAYESAPLHFSKDDVAILVIIGPEGGIAQSELAQLLATKHNNIQLISLGKRILRAETAAIYTMSILSAAIEQNIIVGAND